MGLPCEQRRLRDYLVTPPDSFPTDGKSVAAEIKALVENRQTASEVRKKPGGDTPIGARREKKKRRHHPHRGSNPRPRDTYGRKFSRLRRGCTRLLNDRILTNREPVLTKRALTREREIFV